MQWMGDLIFVDKHLRANLVMRWIPDGKGKAEDQARIGLFLNLNNIKI